MIPLSTKDNVKLTKQLKEGFKRHVHWNEYKTKAESRNLNNDNPIRFYRNASFQGVKRFFVLAFENTDNGNKKVEGNSHRQYFLPIINIINYNVLINDRSFYDQPINDQIKKYNQISKKITKAKRNADPDADPAVTGVNISKNAAFKITILNSILQ